MSSPGSVTQWIRQLEAGDECTAPYELFDRYFQKLVALARRKLRAMPRAAADEEDVALSTLGSFFLRVRDGQYQDVTDRDQLWALLVTIATRKAVNQRRRELARKRSCSGHESEVRMPRASTPGVADRDLEDIISRDPTPDMVVQLAEECRLRLDALDDAVLRTVAQLKLQGYKNVDIARILEVAERTVGRKLYRIRREWLEELQV